MESSHETGTFGRIPTVRQEFRTTGEVTPSVAFKILADEHRRFVCYLLAATDDPIPIQELVSHLSGSDPDPSDPVGGLPNQTHRRLYHNHIPRLAEHGVVEYDREAETVSLTALGEKLEPYLDVAKAHERIDIETILDD